MGEKQKPTYEELERRLALAESSLRVFSQASDDGHSAMAARLAHDMEEHGLFKDSAGDLAFALYKLELEKRREATEKEIIATLESISDAFFALDDNMVVTYFNGAAERQMGRSATDVVGKNLRDAFPELRDSIFEKSFRKAIRDKCSTIFETYFDISPYRNWYEVRVYPRDKGISVYFLVTTDRKQAEEKLRFQACLLDAVEQAVIVTDTTGQVVYWNPFAEKLYGWSAGEAVGRSFLELVATRQSRRHGTRIIQRLQSGQSWSGEYMVGHRNGNTFLVHRTVSPIYNIKGELTHIIGISSDITQRKQRENALQKSEERLRNAQRIAKMGDFIWEVETGRVTGSDALLELLGYDVSEIHEFENISSNIYHPDDLERINQWLHACIVSDQVELTPNEYRLICKNGEIIHVRTQGLIERDADKPIRVFATIQDITQRKRAEEEKERLEEQFHQVQKMESVGRLAGGVAHDLNNLLSPILGYTEMLLEDRSDNDESREALEEILTAGKRARDLVRRLLAFSSNQNLKFKPTNLNRMLEKITELLRRTIREDVAIEMRLSRAIGIINGDGAQLEQVVMSLAINAQDAMPNGGQLIFETVQVELDQCTTNLHQNLRPGSYIVLVVSDSGCGMTAETLEHLFEPFFTTKPMEKGTGLGLAAVYGIVKQHGGTIRVDSEPGLGTTFKIYLPMTTEDHDALAADPKKPADTKAVETILLVEDNEQVRKLALAILRQKGYTVFAAAGGQDALGMLQDYDGPVHLLLTDVVMPKINGKQLFLRMRDRYPDLKVVYMSGYTDNVIAQRGVIDAEVRFIQKPFSVEDLAITVREALDQTATGKKETGEEEMDIRREKEIEMSVG